MSLSKSAVTTIFIGNPGTGKSTMLNSLIGEVKFQSGISIGHGLTKIVQWALDQHGNIYADTPGLSDIKLRKQAAAEITKALKKGGLFKIVFVITLEEGRIRADDKTTMQLVLEAAPIGHFYGVIINKMQPEILEELKKGDTAHEFLAMLNEGLPGTVAVHYNMYQDSLRGKNNVKAEFTTDLIEFIRNVPVLEIDGSKVNDIKETLFDKIKEELSEQIRLLNDDKDLLAKKVEEQKANVEKLMLDNQRQMVEMARKHADQMTTLSAQLAARNSGGGGRGGCILF